MIIINNGHTDTKGTNDNDHDDDDDGGGDDVDDDDDDGDDGDDGDDDDDGDGDGDDESAFFCYLLRRCGVTEWEALQDFTGPARIIAAHGEPSPDANGSQATAAVTTNPGYSWHEG